MAFLAAGGQHVSYFVLSLPYSVSFGGLATTPIPHLHENADNHIWAAGSITAAVAAAKKVGGFCIKIEVEAGNLKDAREAAGAGADIVSPTIRRQNRRVC